MANITRPVDIARKLGISTSVLRHYERWGIIPAVPRTESGYRNYTEIHIAYLRCFRSMSRGYGFEQSSKLMQLMQRGEFQQALWAVQELNHQVFEEKRATEQAIEMLKNVAESDVAGPQTEHNAEPSTQPQQSPKSRQDPTVRTRKLSRKHWHIGEAAAYTHVSTTAIRHWEKLGLLEFPRESESGYRTLSGDHIRRILFIRTMRLAGYSLEQILEMIRELDTDNTSRALQVAQEALEKLNEKVRNQLNGMASFYTLSALLGYM